MKGYGDEETFPSWANKPWEEQPEDNTEDTGGYSSFCGEDDTGGNESENLPKEAEENE